MFEGGGLGLVFVRRDEAVCTVQYHAACTVQWGPGDTEPGSAPLSTISASFRRGRSRSAGRNNLLIFIQLGTLKIKN